MGFPINLLRRKPRLSCKRVNKISLFSPAKINVYLNIVGRYRNGFHKIVSLLNRINLGDRIEIIRSSKGGINLFCNQRALLRQDNLCVKAAYLMKERYKLKDEVTIILDKRIPLGSGLGGASSNAATVLLGIDRLFNLRLTKEELLRLGAWLGSDVNFFIHKCPWAIIKGKGDEVYPLNLYTKFKYLLVYPNEVLSTASVYNKFKGELTKFIDNVNILIYAIRRRDYFLFKREAFNILEWPAAEISSKLKEARNFFVENGIFWRMTGAGSSFYTLEIKEKPSLINPMAKLMRRKGWSVYKVQTY